MRIFIAFLVMLLVFLSGCEKKYDYAVVDDNVTLQTEEQEKLAETFLEYWDAFSKKDFDKSYQYEMQYMQYLHSLPWYKEFFEGNRKNYSVSFTQVSVHDEKAMIKIKMQFEKSTVVREDIWYKVSDEWRHIFRDSILPEH
jgi:hypothetical protein